MRTNLLETKEQTEILDPKRHEVATERLCKKEYIKRHEFSGTKRRETKLSLTFVMHQRLTREAPRVVEEESLFPNT